MKHIKFAAYSSSKPQEHIPFYVVLAPKPFDKPKLNTRDAPIKLTVRDNVMSKEQLELVEKYLYAASVTYEFLEGFGVKRLFASLRLALFRYNLVKAKEKFPGLESMVPDLDASDPYLPEGISFLDPEFSLKSVHYALEALCNTYRIIAYLEPGDSPFNENNLTKGQFSIFTRKYMGIKDSDPIGFDINSPEISSYFDKS